MPEPKATKSTVSPHEPEDWPHLFEQRLNAGDLDEVMTLYQSEARFVARSGETLVGHDRIREVLGGMTAAAKTRLHSRVVKSVTVGDIALLSTYFEGTIVFGKRARDPPSSAQR
jgi:ketosteroid isomerase-like protein